MHKSLVALASAAGIGLVALVAPGNANAGCYGCAVGLVLISLSMRKLLTAAVLTSCSGFDADRLVTAIFSCK